MDKPDLTVERLLEVLDYDPETGIFTWLRSLGGVREGSQAGMIERGYRRIRIDGRFYFAHRLAWLYMVGRWPENMIDHQSGARDDNRWVNLQECDWSQNAQNTQAASRSRSGLKGVFWHGQRQKWQAEIMVHGKKHRLGLYVSKEDAHAAYLTAKARLHTFQPVPRHA